VGAWHTPDKARLATLPTNHTRSCGEELRACFAPGAAAPADKMDVDGAAKAAGAAAKGEATRGGAGAMEMA